MPSLKDVKMKIVGVRKTKQITKAMNMVASAKLRGAQSRIERFRPYAEKFQAVLGDLAAKSDGSCASRAPCRVPCLGDHSGYFGSRPVRRLQRHAHRQGS